ncbi:MAG TPA: intein-containing Rv2578c family radical SAM protein [Streptosporangiaceae bacterium]
MRWESLQLNAGEPDDLGKPGPRAQPLFERGAVARTFDTPGFDGMTFYEVQARSIINRVPEASRMAFRWTINPYRGCTHACAYCLSGETPILMADGRTRPLAEITAGQAIYGTVRERQGRRYVITEVQAHWKTVKPAYRVTLADGTGLTVSGDHRFLAERGWLHVTGGGPDGPPREHLIPGDKLIGTGRFAEPPKESAGYRRGYLCGMIRGGLAGAGLEALGRARGYLARDGGDADRLSQWPEAPSPDWRTGFLAGAFDTGGSHCGDVLRIANSGWEMLGQAMSSLEYLGFDAAIDRGSQSGDRCPVRLRGGLAERLRFFHATDPATTGMRSIEGTVIERAAGIAVTAIEPLGLDLPMFDITTGTGDFIADGVVSHNCFARKTHTYLDLDAGLDFNSKIVVKVNAPELARREVAAKRWRGEHIAMGTNVDCYQRAEGRYRLMPGIITALRDAANPFSILTKGTLILRDLELLIQAAEVTEVGLNVSVGFVDKELWRSVEPGTPAPQRRLEACATLNGSGLRCGVLMGPVVPFLSDSPAQLAATVRQIAAAGATHVSPIVLHLRPGAREWFYRWLGEQHPDLVARYRALYRSGAYAPRAYQQRIAEQVAELARRHGIGRPGPGQARAVGRTRPAGPRDQAVQLTLL